MLREELIMVLKAQQWEKCKGELKSLIALSGSAQSTSCNDHHWQELDKCIASFITEVEDNGLHE